MAGRETQRLGHVLFSLIEFVGIQRLQSLVEGFFGFGREHWLAGNADTFVRGELALQVDVDLSFDGHGNGDVFLRSLVSGRLHDDGERAKRARDKESAAVRGGALIEGKSVVKELYRSGGGDGLAGTVAHGN